MNKKIVILSSIVLVAIMIIAVMFSQIFQMGVIETTQVANPASVFCIENGGTLDIIENIGMCNLPDGTECEEWEYFRGTCPST